MSDREAARWQERIERVVAEALGGPIPAGVGAESGDVLDDVEAVVRHGLVTLIDERDDLRVRLAAERDTLAQMQAEADAAGVPGCYLASWLRAVMAVVAAARECEPFLPDVDDQDFDDDAVAVRGLRVALAALDAEERDGEPAVRERVDPAIQEWRLDHAKGAGRATRHCAECEALDAALREAGL